LLAAGLVAAFAAAPAGAQTCRLALSLAIDESSSVDAWEYGLQSDGLAHALTAPEVVGAFLAVPGHHVALHIFEWSGRNQQVVRQDWVSITSAADLAAVAERIRRLSRSHSEYPTALGFAMGFGARVLEARPECWAHTLDISGDGTNNDGFSPELARQEFPFEGVTVNGLVVGATRETLKGYYERNVISGPGAFVEMAVDYTDYEATMKRKLLRELGVGSVSALEPEGGVLRR
jgi:hypothetical protein